jgi:hypothetical protein
LIDQEGEQFQRRGVGPVQVFHDKEHRLLGRNAPQNRQEGLQRPLLLLLRRPSQRRIVRRQRQGEEGHQEGHRFGQWQAILHQEAL